MRLPTNLESSGNEQHTQFGTVLRSESPARYTPYRALSSDTAKGCASASAPKPGCSNGNASVAVISWDAGNAHQIPSSRNTVPPECRARSANHARCVSAAVWSAWIRFRATAGSRYDMYSTWRTSLRGAMQRSWLGYPPLPAVASVVTSQNTVTAPCREPDTSTAPEVHAQVRPPDHSRCSGRVLLVLTRVKAVPQKHGADAVGSQTRWPTLPSHSGGDTQFPQSPPVVPARLS